MQLFGFDLIISSPNLLFFLWCHWNPPNMVSENQNFPWLVTLTPNNQSTQRSIILFLKYFSTSPFNLLLLLFYSFSILTLSILDNSTYLAGMVAGWYCGCCLNSTDAASIHISQGEGFEGFPHLHSSLWIRKQDLLGSLFYLNNISPFLYHSDWLPWLLLPLLVKLVVKQGMLLGPP